MSYFEKIQRYGFAGSLARAIELTRRRTGWNEWRFRDAISYVNPGPEELAQIETALAAEGVIVEDYAPPADDFEEFKSNNYFPASYHGGPEGGLWDEKLLEHWISFSSLGLADFSDDDVYVDVAASTSPWAKVLRERHDLQSFAIDIARIGPEFRELSYYRREDATGTKFASESVKGASLQCAFEMFQGAADQKLILELGRILAPGGKVLILPLYMHTHYCAYSTPEYYGRGFTDNGAIEYIRFDTMGVPSSRKYDAVSLNERILKTIKSCGMSYRLLALRNKEQLGSGIYCHFILEITR